MFYLVRIRCEILKVYKGATTDFPQYTVVYNQQLKVCFFNIKWDTLLKWLYPTEDTPGVTVCSCPRRQKYINSGIDPVVVLNTDALYITVITCELLHFKIFNILVSQILIGCIKEGVSDCCLTKPQQFYSYKGNNKITELRTILQRESQNS